MTHSIRLAVPEDSEGILRIYAPFIRESAVSFETEVPTVEEFARRIQSIAVQYPYLVSLEDGEITAYAYASRHRERAAYRYDVDVSVYASPHCHGKGVAAILYHCLFELLAEQGYYNAYAGYTVPNEKSRRFHEKCGFRPVGVYHSTGYKLGRWHDVAWVEKAIVPLPEEPGPIVSIQDLPVEYVAALLAQYSARLSK